MWLAQGQSQSVATTEFKSQCFDRSARILDQGAIEPFFFSITTATSMRCGLFSEDLPSQSLKYFCLLQKTTGISFCITYDWIFMMPQQSLPKRLPSQYTGFLWPPNWTALCGNKLCVWTAQFKVFWFSGTSKDYSVFLDFQESFREFLGRTLFCYY